MRIIFLLSTKISPSAFETGLSWLHQMAFKEPGAEFLLLTDKTQRLSLPGNVAIRTIPSFHHWFPFATAQKIKRILREWNPDGMVVASGEYPLSVSIPLSIIYTEAVHQQKRLLQRKQLLRDRNRARFLVFPSQETAALWQQLGTLTATQLHIIAPVASPSFTAKSPAEKEQYRAQYAARHSYFMLSGLPQSAEEFTGLLKAFSAFKKRQQSSMKLLIPFDLLQYFPRYSDQLDTYKYRDELIITGEIGTDTRAGLAAAAYALIMTESSGLAEAFVMESLQAGTPLLIPRTAAAETIAGPSALYTLPDSTQDLAEKMMLIYKDETLRNQLIAQGQLQKSIADPEKHCSAFAQLLKALAS